MTFPIYGNIKNVPNHQPDLLRACMGIWTTNNNDYKGLFTSYHPGGHLTEGVDWIFMKIPGKSRNSVCKSGNRVNLSKKMWIWSGQIPVLQQVRSAVDGIMAACKVSPLCCSIRLISVSCLYVLVLRFASSCIVFYLDTIHTSILIVYIYMCTYVHMSKNM